MKPLSDLLTNDIVEALRSAIADGQFEGFDFQTAMSFILTDGIVAIDGLPVASCLQLDTWVRQQADRDETFTATELKNKTGLILDRVRSGKRVIISKHGRPIAEIRAV